MLLTNAVGKAGGIYLLGQFTFQNIEVAASCQWQLRFGSCIFILYHYGPNDSSKLNETRKDINLQRLAKSITEKLPSKIKEKVRNTS